MVPFLTDAPRAVGVYAQSLGAAVLTRLGYQLAMPMDPTLPFDLLASRDGAMRFWTKVQVKQASRDGTVSLRRGDKKAGCKRYISGDFDLLLVVDVSVGSFLIPYAAIQQYRSRVCVRDFRFARYRVAGPVAEGQPQLVGEPPAPVQAPVQLALFPARAA